MVTIPLEASVEGLAEEHAGEFQIPTHQHDVPQLIYATAGVMTVETAQGAWVVPPERAVWVPPGVSHSIDMKGRTRFRTLYIRSRDAPLRRKGCTVVRVTPLLRECIERFFAFGPNWSDSRSDARIVRVMLDEIRGAPTAPLHLPMPSDERAYQVAIAIRSDPSVRRSIRAWAKTAGASERTLERLWVNEVGMTLGRWQQQARLLRALELLALGHPVTAVALEVGFETPSAFIAMFRQAFGTTPARYFRFAPHERIGTRRA